MDGQTYYMNLSYPPYTFFGSLEEEVLLLSLV
jgi:hypothetical protein